MRRLAEAVLGLVAAILALRAVLVLYQGELDPTWSVALAALSLLLLALSRRHGAAVLVLASLIVYLGNGKVSVSGDTMATRYLPLSILREGDFDLDEFAFMQARNTPYSRSPGALPYFVRHIGDHYVSAYTVEAALLALPFYVPSVLGGVDPASPLVARLEKLAGATIAALSVGMLYLALRRLTGETLALLLGMTYSLGTSTLSWSSQALWQHGAAQLALCVTIYCLVRARDQPAWAGWAGFPLAFAVFARPNDLLLALPLFAYIALEHRSQVARFCLSALPPVLFQACYNAVYYGQIWLMPLGPTPLVVSGQGLVAPALEGSSPPVWGLTALVLGTQPFWVGLAGILVSPGRGLLIYSPVFWLSLGGMAQAWRGSGDRLVRWLSLGVVLELVLVGSLDGWWGGHSFGPRMLADLAPVLVFCLYPLQDWLRGSRWARGLFGVCLACSVVAHSIGAYVGDSWNSDVDVDFYPACLWSWDNNQLVNPLRRLRDGVSLALHDDPTSLADPGLLAASYEARVAAPNPARLKAGSRVEVYLSATNRGRAVWLSGGGPGSVRLRWRWLKQGSVPVAQGGPGMGHHVFPGDSYGFRIGIPVPTEPGRYSLEMGLVSEYVGSFADLGIAPLRREETVVP